MVCGQAWRGIHPTLVPETEVEKVKNSIAAWYTQQGPVLMKKENKISKGQVGPGLWLHWHSACLVCTEPWAPFPAG